MRKSITNLLTLFLTIVLLFVLLNNSSEAATKRVLIEQHTGAWCGWCVDGTYIMEQILEEHPDRVIGVKLHNRDSMTIAEQAEIKNALGLQSYPQASFNRTRINYDGKESIFFSRDVWKSHVETLLQEIEAAVDLTVRWFYNAGGGTIEAEISGEVLSELAGITNVNIFICEDDVTGTGSGYDQSNALSGLAGYEDNPYYSLPSPIKGYHHMKVVRAMMGGSWGTEGVIPDHAPAGTKFSKVYSWPVESGWNIDNVFMVGVIQYDNPADKSILNCVIGEEILPNIEVSMAGSALEVVAQGNSMERNFTLRNTTEMPLEINIEVSTSERMPQDWEISYSVDENSGKTEKKDNNKLHGTKVTVNPGDSVKVNATITPGTTLGVGDLNMVVTETNNANAIPNGASMKAVSKEFQRLEVLVEATDQFSYASSLAESDYQGTFTMANGLYEQVIDDLSELKTVIVNTGLRGSLTSAAANSIITRLDNGVNVLIAGGVALPMLSMESSTHPLFAKLGTTWKEGDDITATSFSLAGVAGDPISDGKSYGCRTLDGGYRIQKLTVSNTNLAAPFFTVNDNDVAIRGELTNARFAILSFYAGIFIQPADQTEVLNETIKWLESAGGPEPKLTLDKSSINFGKVLIGEPARVDITVQNTGDADLIISSIDIGGLDAEVYDVVEGFVEGDNITVEPKGIHKIAVEFAPVKAGTPCLADLKIVSNNVISTATVPMMGMGVGSDVAEKAIPNLSVVVGPNPFHSETTITVTLSGEISRDINLFITDQNGRFVTELANQTFAPGEHSLTFNGNNYASGTYFIQAVVGSKMLQIPVVLVK